MFQIIGDTANAAGLAVKLKTGNLAELLSSDLSETYNTNITARVSAADVEETSNKPEGEKWVLVDGKYVLRACPLGFLLVNTTTETQVRASAYVHTRFVTCLARSALLYLRAS